MIVFLPLGIYFSGHPDDLLGHTANLSIFDPRVNQGNIPLALWNNLVLVAGSFLVRGDHEAYRNVVQRPVFDPLVGAFFILGVVACLAALLARRSSFETRLRAFVLGAWLVVWMTSSITSDDAPSFLRMLPGISAAMMLAAWGVTAVWTRLRGEGARRVAAVVFTAMMFVSGISAFRDYVDFGQSGAAYLAFDGNVADAATWVNRNAPTAQVYMAPLWAIQGTMRVMARDVPIKSYESRDTVVLPTNRVGKDALYVFPWEQERKAQTLGSRLGPLAIREDVTGTAGFPVAVAIRVPASNLPDAQDPFAALGRGSEFVQPQKITRAVWADSFELLGYSVQATDDAKRNLEVTLFFHTLKPITTDYTFSVKVRDAKDRVWGQEDKWLGDNSYATTQWAPGDVIIERFYPGLNACAPGGDYGISVEAYDPKTMHTLALSDRDGSTVSLGTTHSEVSPSNRLEDLEIDQPLKADAAAQANLLGFTLNLDQVHAGEPFSLSLFWQGAGDGKPSRPSVIKLLDAAKREFILADNSVTLPVAGRGLCQFNDLVVPQDATAGAGALYVNDVRISAINIPK